MNDVSGGGHSSGGSGGGYGGSSSGKEFRESILIRLSELRQ